MSWVKGGEKHCRKLPRHDAHYWWFKDAYGVTTAYWCEGLLVMEGGHFGPHSFPQEER